MELNITGKNLEVTAQVRDYIQRKLGKMNRYLPNIIGVAVEIFEEKTKSPQQHFVVQVTVDSSGTLLRGEERGKDLFTAIDKVATVINRQIRRYKERVYNRGKGGISVRTQPIAEIETRALPKVVKVKRFAIKPMSVEEAIDQMELLGHDFFLFRNAETEDLNLLYRRKDGNYGLIEPEVE